MCSRWHGWLPFENLYDAVTTDRPSGHGKCQIADRCPSFLRHIDWSGPATSAVGGLGVDERGRKQAPAERDGASGSPGRSTRPPAGGWDLSREILGQFCLEGVPGKGTDETFLLHPVLEQDERGDAHHVELHGGVGVLVDIQLGDCELVYVLGRSSDQFEGRCYLGKAAINRLVVVLARDGWRHDQGGHRGGPKVLSLAPFATAACRPGRT